MSAINLRVNTVTTMNVSRITQWHKDGGGYTYVNDDGDYYTRLFMDGISAEDLYFPVMLGPISPDVPETWEF